MSSFVILVPKLAMNKHIHCKISFMSSIKYPNNIELLINIHIRAPPSSQPQFASMSLLNSSLSILAAQWTSYAVSNSIPSIFLRDSAIYLRLDPSLAGVSHMVAPMLSGSIMANL